MKKTILIVDDDESIRVSLALSLEDKYHVVSVSSGEEALDKLDETHIDIVFLDIFMEGMDGWATLKKIRKRYRCLIIIMFSVLNDKCILEKAFQFGANDYLCKPYKKDTLLKCLEKNEKKEKEYLQT